MKIVLLTLGVTLMASNALADAVESAYAVCSMIDSTGLASSPCEVSGWSGLVTATIDMNGAEARKLCVGMVTTLAQKNIRFPGRQWTLQIKSPYSGANSIAYCNLPQ